MRMEQADRMLSTYTDQSLGLMAITFVTDEGKFGVRYYRDKVWKTDEIYEGHNEEYAENAAENYVQGIKVL